MERVQLLRSHLQPAPPPAGAPSSASASAGPPARGPRTAGAPPPFACNDGAKFEGADGGVAAASAAAAAYRAKAVPLGYDRPGPIQTKWGVGFKSHGECLRYIQSRGAETQPGELAIPLRYIACEEPTFSHVPSNKGWKDGTLRKVFPGGFREEGLHYGRRNLYFPQVLRNGRRLAEYRPGLHIDMPEAMDLLGVNLVNRPSEVKHYYQDHKRVAREYYTEVERLLVQHFPGATGAYVFDHNVSDKDAMREERQDEHDPGVGGYANLVHNDYTDNSGPGRLHEVLTKKLRDWSLHPAVSEEEASKVLSRRFMEVNCWRPVETVEQNPFALCAWPSFADQPYITNYRIYDDRVGETTSFTHRAGHEWYWFPQQTPDEMTILKCFDSVTDGSVSRWSFHTACIDHTATKDAPSRKNIVCRAYVFF